jgi:hypothetical protein
VLLSGLSLTRRWLLYCSSPLSKWLFCGSSVGPMRLLYGSCCSFAASSAALLWIVWAPLWLPCAPQWLLCIFCGPSGLFCSSLVPLSCLSVTRLWLLGGSSSPSRWLFCGSSVAPMRLLCGSSKAPVAHMRLPLRLFCESSGLLCGSLVLLCGFSVTRLWLFCCSSPPYRWLLCGSSVAPLWLLCGSSLAPL